MSPKVGISLACWPGLTHLAAAQVAMQGVCEPLLGDLHADQVQLVPQSTDVLDERLAEVLVRTWPQAKFRLHANVRVVQQRRLADLGTFDRDRDWFDAAARIHRALGSTVYTAHAGRRGEASLWRLFDNARRCADLFDCPVAIEGHYPSGGEGVDGFLVSSWTEYRALLEGGVPYALDLSHIHILAHRSGRREKALVADMLASPACLEVHISDNDGTGDTHAVLCHEPWWWPLLQHIHPGATVFSEGNHRRHVDRHRERGSARALAAHHEGLADADVPTDRSVASNLQGSTIP